MAGIPISQLQNTTLPYTGSEEFAIVQSDTTKAGSLSSFIDYFSQYTGIGLIQPLTGNWENTYNTVTVGAPDWNNSSAIALGLLDQSAPWTSTYTTVYDLSAGWSGNLSIGNEFQDLSGGWESTRTTVNTYSAAWDNASLPATESVTGAVELATAQEVALANETTGDQVVRAKHLLIKKDTSPLNALSIGDLGGNTRGVDSITIQPSRDGTDQVAGYDNSIAIGVDSKSLNVAAIAIGKAAVSSGVAIGDDSSINTQNSIGLGDNTSITSTAGDGSIAIGSNVSIFSNNNNQVAEMGLWPNSFTRSAAVRLDESGIVTLSLRNLSAVPVDGGATVGSELSGTLPRDMYAIRRDGTDLYIDTNDDSGNITTIDN